MSALLVGYARCSTDQQDLTAQRDGLVALGVEAERIHVDDGLTRRCDLDLRRMGSPLPPVDLRGTRIVRNRL